MSVSVIVCCVDEDRWNDLVEAVDSALGQTIPPLEVIVVVDHNDALLARVRVQLPNVRSIPNDGARGASGARNAGVATASGDLLAFLDDDAVADPAWLEHMLPLYGDHDVIGVGGKTLAQWLDGAPAWLPDEFGWVVGATHRGVPKHSTAVRNAWTGNMTMRRMAFDRADGFRVGFGKVGNVSRPEDTELCIRAARCWPNGVWMYQPSAVVHHKVSNPRATFGFFVGRCRAEGAGKAELRAVSPGANVMSSERRYVTWTLPSGIVRESTLAVWRRDLSGLCRAGAMIVGLVAAGLGYAQTRLRAKRAGSAVSTSGA